MYKRQVVGYGTQKKATLTGAVASLKGEELAKVSQPNMKANLIGKIPGVRYQESTGEPGVDSSDRFNIRGFGEPLVIVDGVDVYKRQPLVYALKMEERWMKKEFVGKERNQFGFDYYEVSSPTKWNYGILSATIEDLEKNSQVTIDPDKQSCDYFWNVRNAPIQIKLKAKEMTSWRIYNEMTGPLPFSTSKSEQPEEEIVLVPYGCTTLRISEFPVVR